MLSTARRWALACAVETYLSEVPAEERLGPGNTERELPGKPCHQLLAALLPEAQLELEFATDTAVLPRDIQAEDAVPRRGAGRREVPPPPSGKRGPMVPSGRDLSLYPLGV